MMNEGKSWGQFPAVQTQVTDAWWRDEVEDVEGRYLPVGLGRSYGDSGLLSEKRGTMLSMARCRNFVSFDQDAGVLEVEAGCSLGEILEWSVPRGFFLPVVPGTKHVTVGGAIANDIHGKNHHGAGTFGRWVEGFELYRSGQGWLYCSRERNREFFEASIGGLGLTGVMGRVAIRMKGIEGEGLVQQETVRFGNLLEGAEALEELDEQYPMTVAWVDMASHRMGRGVAMGGRFVSGEITPSDRRRLRVPCDAPSCLLSRPAIRGFNSLYSMTRRVGSSKLPFTSYFFPLDGVEGWNRLYGRRGFLQYQCVVPMGAIEVLVQLQELISSSGQGAFLSVLKKFGSLESPGWLSFPMPGWTLAMDFPMESEATLSLLGRMDILVREAGGRLYPAKDARMDSMFFQESFPRWAELEKMRDESITSEFWERVAR
ncbi:MAG: FAD-binding oxidoreductase [Roseibacillus sp.]